MGRSSLTPKLRRAFASLQTDLQFSLMLRRGLQFRVMLADKQINSEHYIIIKIKFKYIYK
jgi:hypothetical protein